MNYGLLIIATTNPTKPRMNMAGKSSSIIPRLCPKDELSEIPPPPDGGVTTTGGTTMIGCELFPPFIGVVMTDILMFPEEPVPPP
jgi:hypothetical protein